eukprot:15478442-Alexandrium_andersonii.AAC.1
MKHPPEVRKVPAADPWALVRRKAPRAWHPWLGQGRGQSAAKGSRWEAGGGQVGANCPHQLR